MTHDICRKQSVPIRKTSRAGAGGSAIEPDLQQLVAALVFRRHGFRDNQMETVMSRKHAPSQHGLIPRALACAIALAAVTTTGSRAAAATLVVTNCADDGAGSLRATVAQAQSGDTVDLGGLGCSGISLASGEIDIGVDDLTLHGPGASRLTIDGGSAPFHTHAVIRHRGAGTLRIDGLSISDGLSAYAEDGSTACIASSGAIALTLSVVTGCNSSGGIFAAGGLSLLHSTLSNNYPVGARVKGGQVSIVASTIDGNSASYDCGGLDISGNGTTLISNSTLTNNHAALYSTLGGGAGCIDQPVTISNSTIAFNSARGSPQTSGLILGSAQVTIESSIIAENVGIGEATDVAFIAPAPSVTGHNNLIMVATGAQLPPDTISADPRLLPLADNGGPTRTMALAAGSPALDAGSDSAGLTTDQRGDGYRRVAGRNADIGAFENQVTEGAGFIGPGFTGSWFDPQQSGQGLTIEVLGGNRFYATWFAFDAFGKQAWFTGVGTYAGNTATITQTVQPEGARWIPNFSSADVVAVPWGTLTFTFSDCSHGRVDFASTVAGFGSNHMNLTRLTMPDGLSCP